MKNIFYTNDILFIGVPMNSILLLYSLKGGDILCNFVARTLFWARYMKQLQATNHPECVIRILLHATSGMLLMFRGNNVAWNR